MSIKVCVGPGQTPNCWLSHAQAQLLFSTSSHLEWMTKDKSSPHIQIKPITKSMALCIMSLFITLFAQYINAVKQWKCLYMTRDRPPINMNGCKQIVIKMKQMT